MGDQQRTSMWMMDVAATLTVAVVWLNDHMPTIAAGLSALWFAVQLWESKTGQKMRARLRKWLYWHGPI